MISISEQKQMRYLIDSLNAATIAYNKGAPFMTDSDWDSKYFQLVKMEKDTGTVYPDSPTSHITYETKDNLTKVEHTQPMLSLDKTKNAQEVQAFYNKHKSPLLAMCKMDGLTCRLTYEGGRLIRGETRGNGYVGEDITHNIKHVSNIPQSLSYTGKYVIDGEIICDVSTFEKYSNDYANPRNFAAGSIRLLNSSESAARNLKFVAWDVIEPKEDSSLKENLRHAELRGFTIVPYHIYDGTNTASLQAVINELKECESIYPIDGVVFKIDDCVKYQSLGETAHHPIGALAFKFEDTLYDTHLLYIDYDVSRNGVLTPVAVFEPIEMDDSIVSRASLHNLNITKELLDVPYYGQHLKVAKMNMIIPQVVWADKEKTSEITFPPLGTCPCCGEPLTIVDDNLKCLNPSCFGRFTNRIDYFVGKKGLDIKGLSDKTITKLIEYGWLNNLSDIFYLTKYKDLWYTKDGFGKKSVDKLLDEIDYARTHVDLAHFIAGLGIPHIGSSASKELAKHFLSWNDFRQAVKNNYNFASLPDFGEIMAQSIRYYDYSEADSMVEKNIEFAKNEKILYNNNSDKGKGLIFVVTGSLNHWVNRNALQSYIESIGGKVVNSVSAKTSYLVNNDGLSMSRKNQKAKELGVPIITEEQFIEKFGANV